MAIKALDFLVIEYGLKHIHQDFNSCFGGNWWVKTDSYYNDSGCFTIHHLPQRGELDFYYSKEFSTIRESLCERLLDISSVEKEIWEKHKKFLCFKNPFFWNSEKKVFQALAEIIKVQIEKNGEFFGIKVQK